MWVFFVLPWVAVAVGLWLESPVFRLAVVCGLILLLSPVIEVLRPKPRKLPFKSNVLPFTLRRK